VVTPPGLALAEMNPEQVIEEVKKSGLRGRGGGGFLRSQVGASPNGAQ